MTVHIAGYEIDVFTNEEHTFDSIITSDPVESGADTTDNIKQMPEVITLTGIVSDTPFGVLESDRIEGQVHSQTALDILKGIRDAREPVTIETSLGTYTTMGMEKLSIPRNVGIGDSLQFSATFKKLRIVTTERTIVNVEVPRVKEKALNGNQSADDAEPPVEDKPELEDSWLGRTGIRKVPDLVTGLF